MPNLQLQLHCQQRVTAEFEEIVVNADLLQVENLTPDACQRFLRRGTKGNIGTVKLKRAPLWRRQRFAVELSIRRKRKCIDENKGRRKHIGRQPLFQKFTQLAGLGGGTCWGHVGHQLPIAGISSRATTTPPSPPGAASSPTRPRPTRCGIRGSSPAYRYGRKLDVSIRE